MEVFVYMSDGMMGSYICLVVNGLCTSLNVTLIIHKVAIRASGGGWRVARPFFRFGGRNQVTSAARNQPQLVLTKAANHLLVEMI